MVKYQFYKDIDGRMGSDSHENVAYYEALAAHYHLFFSNLAENMEQEGRWLSDLLHEYGCHTVLDASCGAGRQSVPLRKRGFDVVGADPSEAMLREATSIAQKHRVELPFLQADFTSLAPQIGHRFDAVIALGNGLCNLDSLDKIESALDGLFQCCKPGGLCVVGIKDFDQVRRDDERFHGHQVVEADGVRTILFEVWTICEPTLISHAYLMQQPVKSGEATVMTAETHEYMLSEGELRDLAGRAGFRVVSRIPHPSEAAFLLRK